MGAAFFWGLVAASSLVLGGVLALRVTVSLRTLGLVMGFGSGVLISAVAYELVAEAFETADGQGAVATGLFAGSAVFFVGDRLIDRCGGADRKKMTPAAPAAMAAGGSALAIVLGIVLDGVPESAVIGLGLLNGEGVSAAMLAAVFLSNLPEAVAATSGLSRSGWSERNVLLLWLGVALVSGFASAAGYVLLDGASGDAVAFVLAFAGGAILTMLADTMMPEAFEHGGPLVGIFTTFGFALAFAISALD